MIKPLFATLCLATCAVAQDPDPGPSFNEYAAELVSPRRVAGAFFSGAMNTALKNPDEWGRTWAGAGRRFASAYGGGVVKYSISYSIAAVRHEDRRFEPSQLRGFKSRGWYAVRRVFVVPRRNHAGETVALGPLCGNLGAGLISNAWLPDNGAVVPQGLLSAAIGVGGDIGWNLLREFVFRKKR